MFKIIQGNKVVDTLKNVIYLRFIPAANKFVATDSLSAHAVYGSDGKTIYQLEGRNCPPTDRASCVATLVRIGETEFNKLTKLLSEDKVISSNAVLLAEGIASKIQELSNSCKKAITQGVTVRLSDRKVHKFELTIEDQLNLATLQHEINNGARKVLYHETGSVITYFDSADMKRILNAAAKHKQYHTAYFNILKTHVQSCTSIDYLNQIYYGIRLSELNLSAELYKIAKENNIV